MFCFYVNVGALKFLFFISRDTFFGCCSLKRDFVAISSSQPSRRGIDESDSTVKSAEHIWRTHTSSDTHTYGADNSIYSGLELLRNFIISLAINRQSLCFRWLGSGWEGGGAHRLVG